MAITVQRLRRLEVWSTWVASGGVRLAIIPDIIALTAISNLVGSDKLTATIPLNSPASAFVVSGAVLRVDESDAVFDEWKIIEGPTDNDQSGTRTVQAAPLAQTDFVDCDLIRRVDSDGTVVMDFESVGLTPTEQLTAWVLPALVRGGLSWVSLGAITPSQLLQLAFAWDNPLSVVKRIAQDTEMELDIRRIIGGYAIDLVPAIGSSAPVADIRFDRNLRPGTERAPSAVEQATRVFPQGASDDQGRATMARATWQVDLIVGNVLTLSDPSGGAGPIEFNGQLAGLNGTTQAYLRRVDGTLTQVTASSASAQSVTVASASGVSVDDLIQFRADVGGGDLVWLDSPPDRLACGLKAVPLDAGDIPSTNNLLKNAAMRDWPGAINAPPTSWTAMGAGTVDKQSVAPYTRFGGHSIHRVGVADGDGLISDAVPIFLSSGKPWVSGYAGLWVVSGQVRVELLLTTPSGVVAVPAPPEFATSTFLGQWEDLGVTLGDGSAFQMGASAVQLRVVQHGATPADFYLDYGQVTESPSHLPFVEFSGGTTLWQAANEALRTKGAPIVSYTVPLADLSAMDPAKWSADTKIALGGQVRVTNPRLSLALTTRVVELQRNYLVPGDTRITLSNDPDDMTSSGLPARPRKSPTTGKGTTTADDAATELRDFRIVYEDASVIRYGWTAGTLVTEVWAGMVTFAHPYPADPWASVMSAVAPLPAGTTELTVAKPAEGFSTLVQVEPRLSDLTPGAVRRVVVNAAPTQPPIVELDDIETGSTGTQWWKITERGVPVAGVEVQTQVGIAPVSPWGAPTRGPGAVSAVRGGLLGVGEYEHDVVLDLTRLSWIMPRITLANGQPPIVLGPFGFDRDKNPSLLSVQVTGTVITIIADSDTRSIKVSNSGGTWMYQSDGTNLIVDVSKTGTNGAAGLGASASDSYLVEARSDPTADVDGSTLTDTATVVIGGGSAPPPTATWDTPGVTASAPDIGQAALKITLKATSAPASWTAVVFIKSGSGSFFDHTADLSPALSAPPTVNTDYSYDTDFTRISGGFNAILHSFTIRADLKDAGGVVQDSRTVYASWYSGDAV
jgi:hypothetical protein